jgi:non-canonical purine NTP pyrophosphatase (RdgB/HAM1 family)
MNPTAGRRDHQQRRRLENVILLTSNPAKYAPFEKELADLGLQLERPTFPMLEFQADTVEESARLKAKWAARRLGREVVVDDAGILLSAYPGFPGPMTSFALKTLNVDAWLSLVAMDRRAEMICVLAWSDGQSVRLWQGRSEGYLDPTKNIEDKGPGPLMSWFICPDGPFAHRKKALREMLRYSEEKRWIQPTAANSVLNSKE